MALELVSPPKKYNQYAIGPNFSASGERIRFSALAALAETPKLGYLYDMYIATRTPAGWVTKPTATPPELVHGPYGSAMPCSYSADLSRWALWASTDDQATLVITTPFQDSLDGPLSPLGPTIAALSGGRKTFTVGGVIRSGTCEGASVDASHFLFSINRLGDGNVGTTFFPEDPAPIGEETRGNVYEAYLEEGVPTVVLLQRDKDGVAYGGSCGVAVGYASGNFQYQRGAVSPDASRIYFSANPGQPEGILCDTSAHKQRIMLRLQTPAGPVISELVSNECTRSSPPCDPTDGNDIFRGASQEGDRVFFTTTRQLASTDLDTTQDLYLHDASLPAGERLTQISAGDNTAPTPGEGAEALGLADFAGNGARAYFVAKGVLSTTANQASESAVAGEPNLYLYQRDATYPNGRTVFVATLDALADANVWGGTPGEKNTAVAAPRLGADPEDQSIGGDGRLLVFTSAKPLTADDTDGGKDDIYRYDSVSGAIERVSKAAPGGEDNGPFGVALAEAGFEGAGAQTPYFGRWVSEDAKTIVFTTKEALDPRDTDETEDAYIWHEGEVVALPSPETALASQPTVSMSGEGVAFVSTDQLLPEDGDGAKDVYLARANGGFPIPIPPVPCVGEACQGPPGPRPGDQGSASGAIRQGNVKQAPCRKGLKRRRGRCVKPKKSQRKRTRKANRRQGGQK
jgi:hypothetical protein